MTVPELLDAPLDPDPRRVPNVRRIAVLRASALGDFVFALPALEALRAAYPGAEITLIARAWHAELLANRPSPVDRTVALPHPFIGDEPGPPPDPGMRAMLLDRLRRERFDLALQLHGGGRNSNPLVAELGARVSAGAATPDARPLDRSVPYRYWQHEVFRNLEIVATVGARPVRVEPRLAVTEDDRAAAGAALRAAGVREGGGREGDEATPLVVLHPGATDPRRRWPPEAFARVGDALAGGDVLPGGARLAITGTASERGLVDAVLRELRHPALDLCGRLDLPALVGVLAGSSLVVANDTGPLHLADAVGARTVGIYWCGNLATAAPPGRTRHVPFVSWRLACPVCGTDCIAGACDHRDSFVADVPPTAVIEAARELLGAEPTSTVAGAGSDGTPPTAAA